VSVFTAKMDFRRLEPVICQASSALLGNRTLQPLIASQAIFRIPSSDLVGPRASLRSRTFYAPDGEPRSNSVSLPKVAQAMRASLFASATSTIRYHLRCPAPEGSFLRDCSKTIRGDH
jgi:hypothetical protein